MFFILFPDERIKIVRVGIVHSSRTFPLRSQIPSSLPFSSYPLYFISPPPRYVILPKDMEKAYKTVIRKGTNEYEFYQ